MAATPATKNSKRVAELMEREEKRLEEATPKSYELYKRAAKSLVNGRLVQLPDARPLSRLLHARQGLQDLLRGRPGDQRLPQRLRLHGPGPRPSGHRRGHQEALRAGTQFALPTEDAIVVAEHLAKSFKLPKWRFVNSGSEATMDAIRIARAFTGRDKIMKIFGSYHGHHDYVMVSLGIADWGDIGPRDNYKSVPYGGGIPQAVIDMTAAVPFNDADDGSPHRAPHRRGPQAGLRDHGSRR